MIALSRLGETFVTGGIAGVVISIVGLYVLVRSLLKRVTALEKKERKA